MTSIDQARASSSNFVIYVFSVLVRGIKLMNNLDTNQLLDYYWKFFELHSSQRMQMINYYITIEVVLIGAYFTLEFNNCTVSWHQRTVSLAIMFISIVFYLLDRRTVFLIKESEKSIIGIEEKLDDESYMLLKRINATKSKASYSKVLLCTYILIGAFGLITLFR